MRRSLWWATLALLLFLLASLVITSDGGGPWPAGRPIPSPQGT